MMTSISQQNKVLKHDLNKMIIYKLLSAKQKNNQFKSTQEIIDRCRKIILLTKCANKTK